ncbi:unnamed protein product [Amoebophrya sp. A120]|nr:unnamed protein product [Amoebophrya sp. A120]|eukprot:GSA120T00005115001.1
MTTQTATADVPEPGGNASARTVSDVHFFRAGSLVAISGLNSKPELNGTFATVISIDDATGRVGVLLHDESSKKITNVEQIPKSSSVKKISAKPTNLELIELSYFLATHIGDLDRFQRLVRAIASICEQESTYGIRPRLFVSWSAGSEEGRLHLQKYFQDAAAHLRSSCLLESFGTGRDKKSQYEHMEIIWNSTACAKLRARVEDHHWWIIPHDDDDLSGPLKTYQFSRAAKKSWLMEKYLHCDNPSHICRARIGVLDGTALIVDLPADFRRADPERGVEKPRNASSSQLKPDGSLREEVLDQIAEEYGQSSCSASDGADRGAGKKAGMLKCNLEPNTPSDISGLIRRNVIRFSKAGCAEVFGFGVRAAVFADFIANCGKDLLKCKFCDLALYYFLKHQIRLRKRSTAVQCIIDRAVTKTHQQLLCSFQNLDGPAAASADIQTQPVDDVDAVTPQEVDDQRNAKDTDVTTFFELRLERLPNLGDSKSWLHFYRRAFKEKSQLDTESMTQIKDEDDTPDALSQVFSADELHACSSLTPPTQWDLNLMKHDTYSLHVTSSMHYLTENVRSYFFAGYRDAVELFLMNYYGSEQPLDILKLHRIEIVDNKGPNCGGHYSWLHFMDPECEIQYPELSPAQTTLLESMATNIMLQERARSAGDRSTFGDVEAAEGSGSRGVSTSTEAASYETRMRDFVAKAHEKQKKKQRSRNVDALSSTEKEGLAQILLQTQYEPMAVFVEVMKLLLPDLMYRVALRYRMRCTPETRLAVKDATALANRIIRSLYLIRSIVQMMEKEAEAEAR